MGRRGICAALTAALATLFLLHVAANAAPTASSATFFLNRPADYDSGWKPIAAGDTLQLAHSLGGNPDHYVVRLEQWSATYGVNQCFTGGADLGTRSVPGELPPLLVGAYWYGRTPSYVNVHREAEDVFVVAEMVRLRIWVAPDPDWDSGWVTLPDWDDPGPAADGNLVLNHALGGSVEDYLIDFQLRGDRTHPQLDVHNRFAGGRSALSIYHGGSRVRLGAYWHDLDNAKIEIQRQHEDDDNLGKESDAYAAQARVRIWRAPEAAYDSGWMMISPGQSRDLEHGLGGSTADCVLELDQQAPPEYGDRTNRHVGGDDLSDLRPPGLEANARTGVYWSDLDGQKVTVYRREEDVFALQVRVRAWCPASPVPPTPPGENRLYLPLVYRGR